MSNRSAFSVCVFIGWSLVATAPSLPAQLAITEVMSSAANLHGTNSVTSGPDFWELTNFGTNTVDLTGFRFSDSAGISDLYLGEDALMFGGRSIEPGESIVFFQLSPTWTNEAQFRSWWGPDRLPLNLQIATYSGRGFSSSSDAVQVWQVSESATNLVDHVTLYEATRGFTFVPDPLTGYFDTLSAIDDGVAFKAVLADDVGSPGFATGPVRLTITRQPQDITVDAGTPAQFDVQYFGLPRARIQWRQGAIPIADANGPALVLATTDSNDAGSYTAELENGLMKLVSTAASLQVNTNPTAPRIIVPPIDLVVTPGQTAEFRVGVRGFPLPTFQWQFKGENIPGATSATLEVQNVDEGKVGLYTVQVMNQLGSTNASAFLTVRPKPDLVITEMMGSRSTNSTVSGRGDWWELTNFDAEPVNLRGYRFDDRPAVLEGAFVITNDVLMQPGESVLFIQDMTPEFFKQWWGEENLPEDVQFVRYTGNGISAWDDFIRVWNSTARDRDDFIARADYVHLELDDAGQFVPVRGISLNFWWDGYVEFGTSSILGECGALQAAASGDIGSPGYIANHPLRPRALEILRDSEGIHLTWKIEEGRRYELLMKNLFSEPDWTPVGQHTATGSKLTITEPLPSSEGQRFYRLRLLPDLP